MQWIIKSIQNIDYEAELNCRNCFINQKIIYTEYEAVNFKTIMHEEMTEQVSEVQNINIV